ncbi:MAG TPA: potassium-transporting ATPase subunit KdpA, partial [Steroidobacteraceae bacterium]|nr:potassium-transporting ATPase subunit KdpA [Steroidobacteraceae bacterium]
MTSAGLLQVSLYLLVLVALVKPLGAYMARVFEGERMFFTPIVGPVERLIYRLAGVDPSAETDWRHYALAVLAVNFIGFVVVFALQRLQTYLPLNPQGFAGVSPDSSFNTAISFASNTNWQGYGGETTMSCLTQALGLGVQNFLSAATGIAVLIALTRGLVRRESERLGNFWVDFTRTTLYVLLPLSTLLAILLLSQGVVQSIAPYRKVALLEPLTVETPVVDAQGEPVTGPDGAHVME